MTAKRRNTLLFLLVPALLAGIGMLLHTIASQKAEQDMGNGLFSWHDEVFESQEQQTLLGLMEEQGLTELYQDFPRDLPTAQAKALLNACRDRGIRVYLLVGEPEWALDSSGEDLRAEIRRSALLGCDGVLADVEPGPTNEWKRDRDAVMETMTEGFCRAEAAAQEEGLAFIVCLSWYYDDYGYEQQLETIVSQGCDTLAIMNYDRTDEIGQIATEAELCRTYGKGLISIYELQEVGTYDLEEIHTYREAGLEALWENWERLREAYPECSAALHEYRSLKEMNAAARQPPTGGTP